MRVSFLGKGGSGKTTLSTSFIEYAKKRAKNVVAVDADVNAHMGKSMGMDILELGDMSGKLGEYFEKERKVEGPLVVIGTTPPDYSTKFIAPTFEDEFFKKFTTIKDNMALITVGTYTDEEQVGSQCYHGKLGSAEIIYNRLLDDKDMVVITDQTAGIDSVGTSMFFVSDLNVFVVEPTRKSVDVFKDFEKVLERFELQTYVVANKIMDEEDLQFIKDEIGEEKILGVIPYSKKLKKFEQGQKDELGSFAEEIEETLEQIYNKLEKIEKNWDRYFKVVASIYAKNCETWYNDYYGFDLRTYINPEFKYEKVIEEIKEGKR